MQEKPMLKPGIRVIKSKNIHYIAENDNKVKRFKPWIGEYVSIVYDFFMEKSIFPKKFRADLNKHYEILTRELIDVHGRSTLELATGSGSAVHFLAQDNFYTGTDISSGLLKQAVKKFRAAGFEKAQFYVTSADDLPFVDSRFTLCLCILSLNFFTDVAKVFQEVRRVLTPGGVFVCSVPVPERNTDQSRIRGMLYSEEDLKRICTEHGFRYEPVARSNGVLLYFKAILLEK